MRNLLIAAALVLVCLGAILLPSCQTPQTAEVAKLSDKVAQTATALDVLVPQLKDTIAQISPQAANSPAFQKLQALLEAAAAAANQVKVVTQAATPIGGSTPEPFSWINGLLSVAAIGLGAFAHSKATNVDKKTDVAQAANVKTQGEVDELYDSHNKLRTAIAAASPASGVAPVSLT